MAREKARHNRKCIVWFQSHTAAKQKLHYNVLDGGLGRTNIIQGRNH